MKIGEVAANNRKHVFEVTIGHATFVFPYANANPAPTAESRVEDVFADPELGREAFTYRLSTGEEGSVHLDAVRDYNEDPSHLADLTLYRLTVQARELYERSGLSAREVGRALGTSTSQLYRLLDPTNYAKSLHQLVSLLHVLGYEVTLSLKERSVGGLSARLRGRGDVPMTTDEIMGLTRDA